MKKFFMNAMILVCLIPVVSVFGQDADPYGTWQGTTYVGSQELTVTLVIEKTENGIMGIVSDSAGYCNDLKSESFSWADGKIQAVFLVPVSQEPLRIDVNLEVKNDRMSGTWEGDGLSSNIELTKKND